LFKLVQIGSNLFKLVQTCPNLEHDQDRNGPAQASPSFHTFTPVSSPNNTLTGKKNIFTYQRSEVGLAKGLAWFEAYSLSFTSYCDLTGKINIKEVLHFSF
jgi:hypothetical protein